MKAIDIAAGRAEKKDKVRKVSASGINERIDNKIIANVKKYLRMDRESIDKRVDELDKEWDIDRMLELNAGLFGLAGVALSTAVSPKWLWLPGIVTAFLVMHAVQGWCPPVPVFRRIGIRTRKEIDREKYALLQARDID